MTVGGRSPGFITAVQYYPHQLPPDYYAPNAILTLQDRGEYLEARWDRGEVNVIYPVGPDEFLDRMYWARMRFERDASGKVTGFDYHILQNFTARKLD